MILLDAMNTLLRMCGHSAVNDPDIADVNAANTKLVLKRVRRKVLRHGYHFNTDVFDLTPGLNGRVVISSTLLRIELPLGVSYRKDAGDGALYLWDQESNDWWDSEVKDVKQVFDIANADSATDDFERLPEDFAEWIMREALAEFYFETYQLPSADLMREAAEASAIAVNSLPPQSIHEATRFQRIAGIAGGGHGSTVTQTGRIWINVG